MGTTTRTLTPAEAAAASGGRLSVGEATSKRDTRRNEVLANHSAVSKAYAASQVPTEKPTAMERLQGTAQETFNRVVTEVGNKVAAEVENSPMAQGVIRTVEDNVPGVQLAKETKAAIDARDPKNPQFESLRSRQIAEATGEALAKPAPPPAPASAPVPVPP